MGSQACGSWTQSSLAVCYALLSLFKNCSWVKWSWELEEVLRLFLSFPLPLSRCWRFICRWCGLREATLVKPFWLSLGAIPPHHSGGIHLGYVIDVTPRACEIEKPLVSVEPVWQFLLLLVVCFCLSRRLCSLAVDFQGVRTHSTEGGEGRRDPSTSAGRQAGRQAVPCTPAGWRYASTVTLLGHVHKVVSKVWVGRAGS